MSGGEVAALAVSAIINGASLLQLWHVFNRRCVEGLNKWSWLIFSLSLTYLLIFTWMQDQHWIIIVNYGVSACLHSITYVEIVRR